MSIATDQMLKLLKMGRLDRRGCLVLSDALYEDGRVAEAGICQSALYRVEYIKGEVWPVTRSYEKVGAADMPYYDEVGSAEAWSRWMLRSLADQLKDRQATIAGWLWRDHQDVVNLCLAQMGKVWLAPNNCTLRLEAMRAFNAIVNELTCMSIYLHLDTLRP